MEDRHFTCTDLILIPALHQLVGDLLVPEQQTINIFSSVSLNLSKNETWKLKTQC